MRYLPLTSDQEKQILKLCNVASFSDLVQSIPQSIRFERTLQLPPALSEMELCNHFESFASKNQKVDCYLGQGAYDHTWPAVLDYLISRGEFLTAYTPYQAELSQGTLQSIFEFQSMIAEMFDMEISNASLYDGSTAAVEAILMSARLTGKASGTVVVSEGVYEDTLKLFKTYLEPLNFKVEIWKSSQDGKSLASNIPKPHDVVGVLMQSPNKWGIIENWEELKSGAKSLGTKSIAHVTEMHILTEHAPPGAFGIDIVSGEGQSLGIPLGFGGPYLGLLCCKKSDVRQLPGRLVGQTEDSKGQRAFCVTLSTREQHIRREKATSNICSNQSLMALRTAIYLTLMGPQGMLKISLMNRLRSSQLQNSLQTKLKEVPGLMLSSQHCFNEVTLFFEDVSRAKKLIQNLETQNIVVGHLNQAPEKSSYKAALTIAVTEKVSLQSIEQLANAIAGELTK